MKRFGITTGGPSVRDARHELSEVARGMGAPVESRRLFRVWTRAREPMQTGIGLRISLNNRAYPSNPVEARRNPGLEPGREARERRAWKRRNRVEETGTKPGDVATLNPKPGTLNPVL